ncbi:MAG: HD domain-containing protein [Chloroflexota bacterium]
MSSIPSSRLKHATTYAHQRLATELPADLAYHDLRHTRDIVVPAAERMADLHDLNPWEHDLLIAAAWFHDIGFVERYENNEVIGAEIATDTLPRYGYTKDEVAIIAEIILATSLPHDPQTRLQSIMIDADMDSLGREDFVTIADGLRKEERKYLNRDMDDVAWYTYEMNFLRSHRYFTTPQRYYRTPGKLQNFMRLYRLRQKAINTQATNRKNSG